MASPSRAGEVVAKPRIGIRFDGDQCSSAARDRASEIVTVGALLRAQPREIILGHQSPIGRLPRAHVNSRYRHASSGTAGRRFMVAMRPTVFSQGLFQRTRQRLEEEGLLRHQPRLDPVPAQRVRHDRPDCGHQRVGERRAGAFLRGYAISRSICAELVKAMASTLPARNSLTRLRTACSSASSA